MSIIEKTRKYLKLSDVVLDYGCGTGQVSNEIAGNVKMGHAIDISSKMIEIAKKKAIRRKIQNIDYAYSTIFDDRLLISIKFNQHFSNLCSFSEMYFFKALSTSC